MKFPTLSRPAARRSLRPAGFTLIEIMIVIMIIGLLAMVAIPNITGALATARVNTIIQNLHVIDTQKQMWSADHKKGGTDIPTPDDLAPYFRNGKMPPKVIGETYNINSVDEQPTATTTLRIKTPKKTWEAGSTIEIPTE